MNFGNLLFPLPSELKKIIRTYEKVTYKLNGIKTAILFNEVCLREGLLPNYTNLRLHDPDARSTQDARNFRRQLIHRQLATKKREEEDTTQQLTVLKNRWNEVGDHPNKNEIKAALGLLQERDYNQRRRTVYRKLVRINGGFLRIPRNTENTYTNLTNYQPTQTEHDLLQKGLNCHVTVKPQHGSKRIEIEVLLNTIFGLEDRGALTTTENLQPLLLAEALTERGTYHSNIMTKEMKDAAKELRQREDIVVRRADKAAAFVLISRQEYLEKLDSILADSTKFRRITRNPIDDIKREANSIIERVNAASDSVRLPRIQGDYEAGYIYGNIKTHKPGNPLRPIISQCPTPTYQLAKTINKLLTPYIPNGMCVDSSVDFLEKLKTAPTGGIIASLDVESLFTNVPVEETITMILDTVYRDNTTPPLNIPESALRRILEICTREAPFIDQRGHMWKQVDGVAMGSPLGVLFANFYMGTIEKRVFAKIPQPDLYVRYVDDTFVRVSSEDDLEKLRQTFEEESVLHFTCERSIDGTIPFLDIKITSNDAGYSTTVYRKPTNIGLCLNGESECPNKYKNSVINSYVQRALSHCSSWNTTVEELDQVSQTLVNNGYAYHHVARMTKRAIDKWYLQEQQAPRENGKGIKLYYRGFMHKEYRRDEAALRSIIENNVTPSDAESKICLTIYYKNKKTAEYVMKNSPTRRNDPMKKKGVVYQILCPKIGCNQSYIGLTTTSLSKRISVHLQEGAVFQHITRDHGTAPLRMEIVNNTSIIQEEKDSRRLRYKEALAILERQPTLNVTQETLLLPTTCRRNPRRPVENPLPPPPPRPPTPPHPPSQQVRRSARLASRINQNP